MSGSRPDGFADPPGRLDAVQPRRADVHEDDVGPLRPDQGDGAGTWVESEVTEGIVDKVPGSRMVAIDGPGHTVYGPSECSREVIDRYLAHGELPRRDVTCPS